VDDADVSWIPDCIANPKKFIGTDEFMWEKLGVEDVPNSIYPLSEKKKVFMQYDGTVFQDAVRHGSFAYVSGRWVPEFEKDTHVVAPFKIPDSWKLYRYIDCGTAAPTACLWIAAHPLGAIFVIREYYKKGTTIRERCEDIIEMSGNKRQRDGSWYKEIECSERYEMTVADHAEFHRDAITGDDLSMEYVKEGLNIQPSTTLGQEARREILRKFMYVDKSKKHFVKHTDGAPNVYIFDTCVNLLWELQKKTFKKRANERSGVTERKIPNVDDHGIDALEFACCDLRWLVEDKELL
jgi:hypothetical protein